MTLPEKDDRSFLTSWEAAEDGPPLQLQSTGMTRLDMVLKGGLPLGKLNIIFGPAHGGKTGLSLSMITALRKDISRICWASIDETPRMAADKLLAQLLGWETYRVAKLDAERRQKHMQNSYPELAFLKQEDMSVDKLRARIDAVKYGLWSGEEPQLLVLDYLELFDSIVEYGNPLEHADHLGREFKELCADLPNTLVLLLHQSNRALLRDDTKIGLEHLNYSGERHADGVILGVRVRRPEDSEHTYMDVSALKNKATGANSRTPITYIVDSKSGGIVDRGEETDGTTDD